MTSILLQVLTPQRFGDVFLYDMPPNRHSPSMDQVQGEAPASLASSSWSMELQTLCYGDHDWI